MPRGNNLKTLKPWKKGQSGNPSGRKKGSLDYKTILKRWLELEEKIKNPVTGEIEFLTQADIITLAQLKEARNGNTQAFNSLLDRYEGKPKQSIENSGNSDLTIRIVRSHNKSQQPASNAGTSAE